LGHLYVTNQSNFQDIVKSIYPTIVARGQKPNYLFRKAENLVNDRNQKCNDINFSFQCQTDEGKVSDGASFSYCNSF